MTDQSKVTPREREAYELRASGETFEHICEKLGIKMDYAKNLVYHAVMHGMPPLKRHARFGQKAEHTHPEEVGEALVGSISEKDFGAFDRKEFIALCATKGVPVRMANAMAKRISVNFGPVRDAVKALKKEEMIALLDQKAALLLDHVDEFAIANASLKDIAIAFSIITEKKLLLDGKPTGIYDVTVRHRIEEQIPVFMAEAKRRGITLDVVPTQQVIEDETKA